MPKDYISIKPSGGVSRVFNGGINRPYNLENAQMELNGFVRSVNKPTTASTAETDDNKPYTEWNGAIVDRASWSAQGGFQSAAVAISDATLNARLYRSVKGTDTEGNDSYRVVKFYSDWDFDLGSNKNWQGEPAIIHTTTAATVEWTTFTGIVGSVDTTPSGDVQDRSYVGYLAIPYDKNGEAGNWVHFTVAREVEEVWSGVGETGVGVNLHRFVDVTILGGDSLESVDIYRTVDMNSRGFIHPGPVALTDIAEGDAKINANFTIDHTYFYYDNYKASDNGVSGQKQVAFRDDRVWVNAVIMSLIENEVSWPIEESGEIVWQFPFTSLEGAYNRIQVPTDILQKGRNHHSIHVDTTGSFDYQYHGASAEVMAAQSDVIMYGNVRLPTKRPGTGVILYKSDASFSDIQVQLEYIDNTGQVYYGPKETFADVESIKFAWQGESALLIFKSGTLFERLTPNEFGTYVTGYASAATDDEGFNAPISYIVNSDNGGTTFEEDPDAVLVDYYIEPNSVFLSASERGMEVSFDSFTLKSDEVVRAIVPARLAEDESIRDYDFYVMTDKSITLYKRTGTDLRTVIPVHNVANRLGVKQSVYTALGSLGPTTINLVTPTRFGVAFIGTDDKIYNLNGRDLQPLDLEIPGLFSDNGGYRDIEYHANCDELWVLFNTAIIWVYDYNQRGWIRNHLLEDVHYNVYYSEATGNIHSWGSIGGVGKTFQFDDDPNNIHESSQYITQPLDDGGQETQVNSMQIDYAVTDYSDNVTTNWARMRHSIRSPKIVKIEESYDAANGRRRVEYDVPANRPFYPTLVGRGHQFRFYDFQELRDIEIRLTKSTH